MNPDDFEVCWREHAQAVFAYAERHVGREQAHDITSATFLSAWRSWDEVPSHARPWLLSAALGQIRNHWRSARRRAALEERLEFLSSAAYDGPDLATSAASRQQAIAALATMPLVEREALLLVAWDGLTSEQAAAVLGCRPSALRMRLHRARKKIDAAFTEAHDPVIARTERTTT